MVSVGTIVAAGAAMYWYNRGGVENIHVVITKPEIITLGEPFTLSVNVSNNSGEILNDTHVSILAPDGVAFVGGNGQKNIDTKNVGRIGDGSEFKTESTMIVTSGEQTVKSVTVTISYRPEGVNSRFEKTASSELVTGNAGLAIDLVAPSVAVSGQDFTLEVSYKNVSATDLLGMQLKMYYPPSFEFRSADVPPDIGGNIWNLGGLRKGSAMKFKIKGNIIGKAASTHEFKAAFESTFQGELYGIGEKSVTMALAESPLLIDIRKDDESGIAALGEQISYRIRYKNTTNQGFRDAVVVVELKGDLFNLARLSVNGVLSPKGNVVTWNRVTSPELAVVAPQSEGVIELVVPVKDQYPTRRLSDRNFVLRADASIESGTVQKDAQVDKTIGVARSELKVVGAINFATKGFFRDAASGIINRGVFPPKVGQPTNYTVHWTIGAERNDMGSITLEAQLGSNVRFTGEARHVGGGEILYDPVTQRVSWQIDRLPAGSGILRAPYEAIFQIEATPSPNLVGSAMLLMSETRLIAHDEFTGSELTASAKEITTDLPDDPTIASVGGRVIP